jgi:hypothetical protein
VILTNATNGKVVKIFEGTAIVNDTASIWLTKFLFLAIVTMLNKQ